MKPDYESLINAGLSKEEIAKISGCEDQEMQIRMLRKYRYKLLDAVHEKQQSLDAIDYMICKIKNDGGIYNEKSNRYLTFFDYDFGTGSLRKFCKPDRATTYRRYFRGK